MSAPLIFRPTAPAFSPASLLESMPSAVVELEALWGGSGATRVALEALKSFQARALDSLGVWVDPAQTLFAPGLAQAGVDLKRLVVVRCRGDQVGAVAVKIARSAACEFLAVDFEPFVEAAGFVAADRTVRRLSLAAQETQSAVVLLTRASVKRPGSLPVALRVRVETTAEEVRLEVTKDRFGRLGASAVLQAHAEWPRVSSLTAPHPVLPATAHLVPLTTARPVPLTPAHFVPLTTAHFVPLTPAHFVPLTTAHFVPLTTAHFVPLTTAHFVPLTPDHFVPLTPDHPEPVEGWSEPP